MHFPLLFLPSLCRSVGIILQILSLCFYILFNVGMFLVTGYTSFCFPKTVTFICILSENTEFMKVTFVKTEDLYAFSFTFSTEFV
ncbi:hypothetical protein L1887_37822 [Cichorium endivia]|nr:hypothetical protein L1887_37822 [Cichorium endivia]